MTTTQNLTPQEAILIDHQRQQLKEVDAVSSPDCEMAKDPRGSFIPGKIEEYKARSTIDTDCIPWNMVPAEIPLPSVQI